jgi:hypothetical protein
MHIQRQTKRGEHLHEPVEPRRRLSVLDLVDEPRAHACRERKLVLSKSLTKSLTPDGLGNASSLIVRMHERAF